MSLPGSGPMSIAAASASGRLSTNGAVLWTNREWKISIATVPSPSHPARRRIFLSGGYDAGSLMLPTQRRGRSNRGADGSSGFRRACRGHPQTPILLGDHLTGVRPDGQFICSSRTARSCGQRTQPAVRPGLVPVAGGLVYGNQRLRPTEPGSSRADKFNLLAQSQVLSKGRECWGPMAMAGGRLLVRDLTRLPAWKSANPGRRPVGGRPVPALPGGNAAVPQ